MVIGSFSRRDFLRVLATTSGALAGAQLLASCSSSPELTPQPNPLLTAHASTTPVSRMHYYVSPEGDDSNPGTDAQPVKTLAKAASMATANVTVFLKQGTYNERLIPVHSGTAEGPVIFMAFPGDSVTITGAGMTFPTGTVNDKWWTGLIDIEGLSYITISGLNVINSSGSAILAGNSSHIRIEKNHTDNTFSPGICPFNCSQVFIDGNEVQRACMGSDQEAISIVTCDDFHVTGNVIHDGITEGIDAKGGCSNGTISDNLVYNQMADRCPPAIYIDAGSEHEFNIEVFHNVCFNGSIQISSEVGGLTELIRVHHNIVCYNRKGRGFWIVGQGQPTTHPIKNIEVYGNTAFENDVGFEVGGFKGTTLDQIKLYNNISYKNKHQGIRITRYDEPVEPFLMKNIEIVNNTIYGNGLSADLAGAGGIDIGCNLNNLAPQSITARNNLVSRNAAFTIHIAPDVPAHAVIVDHNLIDGFRGVANETRGTSPVLGNPSFIDAIDYDFHLAALSAAIDKGSPEGAPRDDFDGNHRPQGNGYDIGAFEFVYK
jgi:hypothetical protein